MDRFSTRGPSEKYPLPFEPKIPYCECGSMLPVIYRHNDAGEMCRSCVDEVLKEYDIDTDDCEEIEL